MWIGILIIMGLVNTYNLYDLLYVQDTITYTQVSSTSITKYKSEYNEEGKLISKTPYIGTKIHGTQFTYYANGEIKTTKKYLNGQLNDREITTYHRDGVKSQVKSVLDKDNHCTQYTRSDASFMSWRETYYGMPDKHDVRKCAKY